MKFLIFDWAFSCREYIEELGFKDRQIVDGDIWETAKRFIDERDIIQVQIKKAQWDKNSEKEYEYILFIDNRNFRQR